MLESIDMFGECITYGSESAQAVVNTITFEEELEAGGISRSYAALAVCKKDAFAVLPKVGAIMLYSGKRFRIAKVETDPFALEITLESSDK